MSVFSENLKFLRGELSQQELAKAIGLTRSDINNYERNNSYPPVEKLLKISGYFKFNINEFLTIDFKNLSSSHLETLKNNHLTKGGGLQVLAITVDSKNRNNIEIVTVKARAGYMTGYGDREFLESLPKFQLPQPILSKDRTYRAFQIDGNSMPPIKDKSWITCEFMESVKDITDGKEYVIVSKDDGIVFKRVYKVKGKNSLMMVSLHRDYEPYEVPINEVMEVWKFVLKFSDQMIDELAA
jgi:transcriptional regulator with XRE-family HTH domain